MSTRRSADVIGLSPSVGRPPAIRHDLEAALFAPVELLLMEDENREGMTVIYDLPSSLMVTRENPPLLEAAVTLDAKLQDLVTKVTRGS
jgi:hypothetical protein